MAFKLFVFAAVLAVAKAGYLGAPAVAAYAAPAYAHGIAAPAYAAPAYAAPAYAAPAYAAPAYAHGIAAPAAITSQHSNILRTPGNLGQVSTYSKTIDTPYSSVSKSDVRVSNDALAYGAAYHAPAYGAYAAPAYAHGAYAAPALHAAPVAAYAAAPAVHAAPVAAYAAAPVVKTAVAAPAGLLGVAYSAAPVVSHMTYSNAYGTHYTY